MCWPLTPTLVKTHGRKQKKQDGTDGKQVLQCFLAYKDLFYVSSTGTRNVFIFAIAITFKLPGGINSPDINSVDINNADINSVDINNADINNADINSVDTNSVDINSVVFNFFLHS